jgi:hypothetical protein
MTAFREMVWSTVRECRAQLPELMFGREPAVNLNRIMDNTWSSKSRGLMRNNQWSQSCYTRYLQLVEAFKQKLFLRIHFTDGLPGRGTEIANRQVFRNSFVYHGRLIIVIGYHKARAITNNSLFVVRVLPVLISKIMLLYLTYIRLLVDAHSH